MKFHTRLCSLLLAGLILFSLSACSDKGLTESPLPSETASPSPSPSVSPDTTPDSLLPDDFVVDTSVEDVCLATLDVPGEFELFTVNGVPVTAYTYLYWLSYAISSMENALASYGMPLTLSADATLAGYAKENALAYAVHSSLITSKAKSLGYEMTSEQLSELEASLALSVAYMGGEDIFLDELRKSGMSYDTFYSINATPYYLSNLRTNLFSEQPTAEEMDAYIEKNDILLAKHILLMTVDSATREPLDEATIAQKKTTAEDILSQLQNSTDVETDFDALMHEYSEDPGLASYPDGYTFTAGEMVAEFENATRALEFGQVSGIVESASTGYHIILRLDPDTENVRAEYCESLMSAQLNTWADEAEIVHSEEYNGLDVQLFYEKYVAYQKAFLAEAQAQAQASQEN